MNVVSVLGGKVHKRMPELGDHFFPFCRTGSMTNRGTKYRATEAAVTCRVCLSYAVPESEAPQEEAFFAPEESEAYLIGEKKAPASISTREEWLQAAIETFRPWFAQIGFPLPARVQISVGFGYGAKAESKQILGECWSRAATTDRVNHIFISPEITDVVTVLATVVHELVHAADDNVSGHKGAFGQNAKKLGLIGKMTATVPGVELTEKLRGVADKLGPYPHSALYPLGAPFAPKPEAAPEGDDPEDGPEDGPDAPVSSGPKKQGTRMVKVVCSEECECGGYVARTTEKWLSVGMPICPFGTMMNRAA
ncbi:hypothetical protein RM863_11745 [Streptomyces sp. DSM 41014]|uniref:SprT-like domain-containing protein n=1 Tax=Streptomyces hintoniae TaxID=3075521 RepID=A0ABU2UIV7_9ACTN|nr:hypothetical protein [Streptomyces sp. DSM 41014]MDT0472797.1 hypothetical protein [Streptomyces sp. DSM 41014]